MKLKVYTINKEEYTVKYFCFDRVYLFSYPFKQLAGLCIVALLSKEEKFKCQICNQKYKTAFCLVKKSQLKKLNYKMWKLFCPNCIDLALINYKLLFNLSDIEVEVLEQFCNYIKNQYVKCSNIKDFS